MKATIGSMSLLTSLMFVGCGTSSSSSPTPAPPPPIYDPTAAHIPACAHAATAIRLPKGFPARFPFPPGTVLTKTGKLPMHIKGVGIDGFVPSSSFRGTVSFFPTQLPRAGFKVLDYQADAPNDSEGTYRGYGRVGAWRLHKINGCPGVMIFGASSEPLPIKSKP